MKLSRYIVFIYWLWPMVNLPAQTLQFAQSGTFQLADPMLHFDSVLFQESATVSFSFELENVSIFYTLNGADPTTGSTLYQHPIVIDKSTQIKARAFHPDCRESEVVSQQFLKVGKSLPLSELHLKYQPAKQYSAQGASTLFDLQKGSADFHDGHWLGFEGNNLEVEVALNQSIVIKKLVISSLNNHSAWIFPIKKLEVYHSGDGQTYQLLESKTYKEGSNAFPAKQQFLTLDFAPVETRFIKIIAHNQGEIPNWHPGAGSPAWLFIDEIILK